MRKSRFGDQIVAIELGGVVAEARDAAGIGPAALTVREYLEVARGVAARQRQRTGAGTPAKPCCGINGITLIKCAPAAAACAATSPTCRSLTPGISTVLIFTVAPRATT